MSTIEKSIPVVKVADEHRIVFGYAMICSEDGQEYTDTQLDFIPESAMFAASVDFMKNSRRSFDMHESGTDAGEVIFSMPFTDEICKAFNIDTNKRGLAIGLYIHDTPQGDDILHKYKTGEYTGFSIGGKCLESVYEEF